MRYSNLVIFARATLTYRAVMQLCRGGFGEQADMLNRSLFEDMTAAHWVSLHPQEAVERIEKHHQHSRVLWRRVIERRGLGEAPDLGLDAETVRALDDLFGPHGSKPWLGINMWDLVCEIEGLWEEEPREQLWLFYELAHRANNQKLHLTSFAIGRVADAREDGDEIVFEFRASPSIERDGPVGAALFGAWWIYVQLAGLIWDVFEIPEDDLMQLANAQVPALAHASTLFRRTQTVDGIA